MKFVFTPPADHAAGLLTLPWSEPLADWQDERLVEIRQRGISRHVVRFVYDDGTLYALKELSERLARREYRLLRALTELGIPAVEVVGIAVDLDETAPRDSDADAILVTEFLSYATTYRAVFSNPRGLHATDGLLDALVELLVRLHLSGFFWGDCSLSNTLFRHDAGTLEAYLVDAETSEQHPELTDGQRGWDVELAIERVFAELLDLQAGELLPADVEPLEIAEELGRRYESLWQELTREEILRPEEQRYRIAERLHRLNELGFDADEVELISTGEGNKLRVKTRVAESGHDARKLFLRTGIDASERQARRLLNDMAGFRAWLEQKQGRAVSEVVAANRWLEEVYDPVITAIPEELAGRLPPAEVFSEVLEHRWYMSEAAGLDVGTTAATRDYIEHVLPAAPDPLTAGQPTGPMEILGSAGDA
jgi:tRNA A-37 threonylcarbamoyl transferase component Bud32